LLRLQQERGNTDPIVQEVAPKQIARVAPVSHPVQEAATLPHYRNSAIPLIDLSDDDTVPYNEYFNPYDPVEEPRLEPPPLHNNLEIIDLEPPEEINLKSRSSLNQINEISEIRDFQPLSFDNQSDVINLEPLDPDTEYQSNIHRMFVLLDEYARNAFLNTHN